jgi:exopolysaccharide biosynthesis polyprenyl glycosylphosphotransferase
MNHKFKKIILILGDISVLYLALYLTLFLRYLRPVSMGTWQAHFWPFSIVFVAWLIIFYISDLYNLHLAVNDSDFFNRTIRAGFIAALLSISFFYANPAIKIAPKTNILIYIFIFTILFILWRRFFNWFLKAYLPKNKIAFIGKNNLVQELINTLRKKPQLGLRVALLAGDHEKQMDGIKIIKNIDNLHKLIKEKNISTIVLASDPHQSDKLRTALFKCLPLKIDFINISDFYESITGKVPLDSLNRMWFLEKLSKGKREWQNLFKRIYDFSLALLLLIITTPFWPFIAIAIKAESKGPIFISMRRAGQNGQTFKMLKFRTMREEGNKRTPTIKDDPRITKFGAFMRKTRIDEIPQIINILINDMSFVGPRPERPELIKELEKLIPFYNERTLVKPGITGWDQVSGEYHSPSLEDSLKKLQYDLFYVKNRSLYLDLSIILKTVKTVLGRGGI